MFQGIIHYMGALESIDIKKAYSSFVLRLPEGFPVKKLKIGDSIAVDGVCLTVIAMDKNLFTFDLSRETIRATRFTRCEEYKFFNLELPCNMTDALNGHSVAGHIDAVLECVKIEGEDYWFSLPAHLAPMIVPKGSISINGVSLTVGEVVADRFCVYLIPKTLELTNLSMLTPGMLVNVEVDMMARYIVNYMKTQNLNFVV